MAIWWTKIEDPEDELLELAWGIIANAYGGDWGTASDVWRGAAERWRDRYFDARKSSDDSNVVEV